MPFDKTWQPSQVVVKDFGCVVAVLPCRWPFKNVAVYLDEMNAFDYLCKSDSLLVTNIIF